MKNIFYSAALLIGFTLSGADRPRLSMRPLPQPEPLTGWNWFPQIPQQTLVCFTVSANDPYLMITQAPSPGGITITPHPAEGYYLVEYLGPAGEVGMAVRFPASQCIYREIGGSTP